MSVESVLLARRSLRTLKLLDITFKAIDFKCSNLLSLEVFALVDTA